MGEPEAVVVGLDEPFLADVARVGVGQDDVTTGQIRLLAGEVLSLRADVARLGGELAAMTRWRDNAVAALSEARRELGRTAGPGRGTLSPPHE